jgi:hypothetical protein
MIFGIFASFILRFTYASANHDHVGEAFATRITLLSRRKPFIELSRMAL